jgi:chloride channel protein, CIC family
MCLRLPLPEAIAVATHRFPCPTCGRKLKVDDAMLADLRHRHKNAHCPVCKTPINIDELALLCVPVKLPPPPFSLDGRDETYVPGRTIERVEGLLVLGILSLVIGGFAGLLGAVFHLALGWADQLRDVLIAWAHGQHAIGFLLLTVACAAATGVAAWLVRRACPHASGSGIPHVEAVLKEELPPAPFRLIPVKFVGGVLAIGSGLALGREGPTVQMGATIAHLLGRLFRRSWADCRALSAAGAGAGLAAAFNAPIAGAVFVLEELVRQFETRTAIAALGASATAILVTRWFLGNEPEFHVEALPFPGSWGLFLALGVVAGFLAVAYNLTLLGAIRAADRFGRWPVELRAALVGGGVGILAWFAPGQVGGGESLTQRTLNGEEDLGTLPLQFLCRFGLGPVSYATRTPGGLFAPMLVLGAQLGLLFATLCGLLLPGVEVPPAAFAVVGMAAFFTGVVRSPVTGIALIIEMTASFTMILPMLAACFAAMLVPTMLRNPPIYDSLRERSAHQPAGAGNKESPRKSSRDPSFTSEAAGPVRS